MADDQTPPAPPAEPQIEPPLAVFGGREPPSPDWFKWAIAQEPERSSVIVDGADIELLAWGERGKPGMMLIHGNSAHADWWSFIAPYLAKDFRVAAISLSGMGASDWRETYSFEIFAQEMRAGAEAAGLYDAPVKPIFVGHSFGGSQVFYAARKYPQWMQGAILVDTGFGGPPPAAEGFRQPQTRTQPNRVYPTLEAALARFRFMPPQGCSNVFIADFIARRSLKRAPLDGGGDGGGEGWTWRFDPFLWGKLDRSAMASIALEPSWCPMVHIYGANSVIVKRRQDNPADHVLDGLKQVVIPDSEHHVMVDQPLALISAIRGVLVGWP
jgi:pimeloyl-ACP methyl ester carboxylesterase